MRKLTILLMILGLSLSLTNVCRAATSGQVAVTSTIGLSLDMSLSPNSWAVPSMTVSDTKSTYVAGTQGYFTVTNNSNGPAYMDIKASITGGCSLGTAPGADIYRLGHGQATTASTSFDTEAATYSEITTSDTDLATIASSGTYKFDLELKSPTSTAFGGVQQTITVTITAKTS